MTLTPRDTSDTSGSELIGVLSMDPAGERAPVVRLMDGTDLGPLDHVLSRFTVTDLSEEESEVLGLWDASRRMARQAADLKGRVLQVAHEMARALYDCERFAEDAARLGFRSGRVPPTPGMRWDRNITAERWNLMDPAVRPEIVRGLLIGLDLRRKLSEWEFDPVEATVLDRAGNKLAEVQLREGYQGPVVCGW